MTTPELTTGEHPAGYMPEAVNLLVSVGNHEAKALCLLYLAGEPTLLSSREMEAGFRRFLGEGAPWTLSANQLRQYCQNSLGPLGSVAEESIDNPRGSARAFGITEYGRETGVPAAALLLDWSLRHPELALSTVFGTTHSRSQKRAAEGRVELLLELLTAPREGISLSAAAHVSRLGQEGSPKDYKKYLDATSKAAHTLERAGIVRIESAYDHNDSEFIIDDSDPSYRDKSQRSALTRAVYEFIQERSAKGQTAFTYEECLRRVVEKLASAAPEMDAASVRRRLASTMSRGMIKGIHRHSLYNHGRATRVFLQPDHAEAVQELHEIVLALSNHDEVALAHGTELAQKLRSDTAAKHTLIEKAWRFSSHTRSRSQKATMGEVLGLVAMSDDALDSATITERYTSAYKRPLSQQAIATMLQHLVKLERIQVVNRPVDPTLRRTRQFYSVPSRDT